jgi:glycosyltransferase involved in cell wall biosynthesis
MKISLVTPVKDEAATLDELIEGVGSQTRPADEWIVVDGGSRDGSLERLERLEGVGGCSVIRLPGNIASARNAGIASASGEIIATIDAGCRPRLDWLERLVAPLEEGTARVAAGATEALIETPFCAAQAALLDQFVLSDCVGWLGRRPALSARCLAFRREVWEQEPFPEWLDYGEDTWLLRRWAGSGDPALPVPDAVVAWRQRPSLASFMKQHFRYMRGDGRAGMNAHRHLLRWGFYGAILASALAAFRVPVLGWVALGAWLAYAALSASGLATLPTRVTIGARLRALPVLLALLPLMDGAKMAGYSTGRFYRLRRERPRK